MKNFGGLVVIDGDNLPFPVPIGLTDLKNIRPPGSTVPASLRAMIETFPQCSRVLVLGEK